VTEPQKRLIYERIKRRDFEYDAVVRKIRCTHTRGETEVLLVLALTTADRYNIAAAFACPTYNDDDQPPSFGYHNRAGTVTFLRRSLLPPPNHRTITTLHRLTVLPFTRLLPHYSITLKAFTLTMARTETKNVTRYAFSILDAFDEGRQKYRRAGAIETYSRVRYTTRHQTRSPHVNQ